ncbi:MAG TPA: class I SAM-dependent methyltransferase [Myxococcota bacterium]|jgi:cyclopropane fatty-acyl-phospholipid synthase-like methyltransferase|nr:class I SAM-dependent methyltransferase [Myxococcota bacterium]
MTHFDVAYAEGTPPWDIGRPQPGFVDLEARGAIQGTVLDVGCGTGEHALYLAARGHAVLGVDMAAAAIDQARQKAEARGLAAAAGAAGTAVATFLVHDALRLETLGRTFDTAIDSGLFHVFGDAERPVFAASLAAAVRPGGAYLMMCFSEHEPAWGGPRRVTQPEIHETFAPARGWTVETIVPARFDTNLTDLPPESVRAWLATIRRSA